MYVCMICVCLIYIWYMCMVGVCMVYVCLYFGFVYLKNLNTARI